MTQPYVIVFPRGQLSAKDKERLTKGGVIAVEADDPQAVCQLQLTGPLVSSVISGDGIVTAAVKAMASLSGWSSYGSVESGGKVAYQFVQELHKSLAQGEKAKSKEIST